MGTGVGEAALISAAIGGATSAATGGDPLKGALLGGLSGGLMSGIGGLAAGGAEAGTALAEGSAAAGSGPYSSIMNNTGGISSLPAASSGLNPAFSNVPTDLGASAASNFTAPMGATPAASPLSYSPTPASLSAPAAAAPVESTFGDKVGSFLNSGKSLTGTQMALAGGSAGLAEAMRAERERLKVPDLEKYSGPLSKFKYDPNTYTPYTYKPFAAGGPVERMSNDNAMGANTGYPQADINQGAYATPWQTPVSRNVVAGPSDANVDQMTGQERMAGGGIASLGSYSDGGRLLRGPGDGMSDNIPATIGRKRPARLADGEFVVPADVVSGLGNGSTDAGAKQLYKMLDKVRTSRTGTKKQGKEINPNKYMPA